MTVYYYDLFTGTAGTLLTSHTADSGATWPNDADHYYGTGIVTLDGLGGVYQSNTGSSINLSSAAMPSTQNFEVLFSYIRKTSIAANAGLIFLSSSWPTIADCYELFYAEGDGWLLYHTSISGSTNTLLAGPYAGPELGVTWYMKVDVSTSGGNTTFTVYYSIASTGPFTQLFSYTAATSTDLVAVGTWFYNPSTASTATTGQHIGALTVQDIPALSSATLSGPTQQPFSNPAEFTVGLNEPARAGGVVVTPASSNGSDTFQATQGGANVSTITIPAGVTSGTFWLTPGGTTGNRTISISAGSLSTPGSPLTYDALTTATTYAVTGASGGHQLVPVTWTITLTGGDFSGTITATPGGGTGQCQIYQTFPVTFTGNGTLSKTFTFTPIGADSVTFTFTNSGSLINPSPETYVSTGIYLEDTFTGSTGTPIQNHSSNALPGIPSGSTWSVPTGGNIQLDHQTNAGTFLESSGTSATLSSAAMPTALPYEVIVGFTQYDGNNVTIADVLLYDNGSSTVSLRYQYGIGFTLQQNGSGLTGANAYPDIFNPNQGGVAFGTLVYIKCDLMSSLAVNVYWATSLSGPWTSLGFNRPSITSLAFPFQCGLQYSLSTQTATTGLHVGEFLVQDIPPAPPNCSISKAYVTTGGQSVAFFFETGLTGSGGTAVIPSAMNFAPAFFQNGTSIGVGTNAWITGYHKCAILQLPSGVQINPGDTITVSAPPSWMSCGTTHAVNGVTNLAITNYSGASCFGTNTLAKTFKPGLNFSDLGSNESTHYNVPKNWRYRLGEAVNSAITRDGYPWHMAATTIAQSFLNVNGTNYIDSTGYPGVPGFWAIGYDDNYVANGGHSTTLSIVSQDNTRCTVQQITGNNNTGNGGLNQFYLFNVQLTAGSATTDTPISLQWTNSAQTPYVSNLWIVGPGDFTVPPSNNTTWTFDRSQPYALSNQLLSRLANGVGSMRWIDATIGYANNCNMTEPWEEPQLTDFSWSCSRFQTSPYPNIAYSQARPFSPSGSYIYQAFVAGQRGSTWTCSSGLSAAITDTTSTTITINSASTDPIFSGILIQIGSEQMYVQSLSGTSVLTVIRGAFGTTAVTHASGATVTILSKRWALSALTDIGTGHLNLVEFVTTAPHGLKGPVQFYLGGSFPIFSFTDGSAGNFSSQNAWPWATGPSTFLTFTSGSTAMATATVSGGVVTNISISYGGFGYVANSSTIPINITGGGGSGASAHAVTNSIGVVTGFTGLVGGSGYTSSPSVSIPFTNNAPATLSTTYDLTASGSNSTPSSWNPSNLNGFPMEFIAKTTGSFTGTHIHVNIPLSATDAYVYDVAVKILNNFPAGRKVYVELSDEPWNWGFDEFGMSLTLSVLVGSSHNYYYIVIRTGQIRTIFRNVFGSRAGEIQALINVWWAYPDTASDAVNLAIANNVTIDAYAVAPYVDPDSSSASITVWNNSNIQQMIDLWIHDLYYNNTGFSSFLTSHVANIARYNATSASPNYNGTTGTCYLYGYEGGFETGAPSGANHVTTLSHDLPYDPNWLIIEQDFYALLQASGFVNLNLYSYGIYYNGSANWGLYHSPYQPYGIGDGSDGKANNRLCLATPGYTHTKAATTNQDQQNISVRGQAFLDWMQPAQAKKRMLSVPYRFVNR